MSTSYAGEEDEGGAVELGLQEAVEILNAATKGCGSYAKPILRHINTVAEFARKDGVQVSSKTGLPCSSHVAAAGAAHTAQVGRPESPLCKCGL